MRACVRACEAVRVREAVVSQRWWLGWRDFLLLRLGGAGSIVGNPSVGFKINSLIWGTLPWVLRKFVDMRNPSVGFKVNSLIWGTLPWVLR